MLKQANRLRRRQDFRRIYQRGKALKCHAFVLYFRPAAKGAVRIGFSVSKKLGKAVERNRVRRKLREAVRLGLAALPSGYDYVLIARLGAKDETVESFRRQINKLLKGAGISPR